jgi:hypothetical protein
MTAPRAVPAGAYQFVTIDRSITGRVHESRDS